MTALELLDKAHPKHDRTSCTDEDACNGFGTRNGDGSGWGRCTRCMFLELIAGAEVPADIKGRYGALWG